jgi:hypothetical protein
MALIKCRECGSEISDSAATCPRCGVSAPGGTGTLTFIRPSLLNGAIGVEIHVDGQPYGRIRPKGRVTVPITPGTHHVELVTSQGRSGVGTVAGVSGDTTVTVKLNALGTPKFS